MEEDLGGLTRAEVAAMIADEVKRQIDERLEQYVKARIGNHGNPMYHPTDTRGLPLQQEATTERHTT
jgi:hypothetical protein